MVPETTPVEGLLRRDRWIVGGGLALLTALAWAYVLMGGGTGMSPLGMTTLSFPPPVHDAIQMPMAWSSAYWLVMASMWWFMMIAMMTPSAAPMILLHARVTRRAQERGRVAPGAPPTAVFLLGYLAVWLGFSVTATVAQWGLEHAGLVHRMLMWSTSAALSGGLLLAAGIYQLTPLKTACLAHCRAPADYLAAAWRPGHAGAFVMGLGHGAYCVGCCWMLMALLFVGGAMNLVWIAGLAGVVLVEKLAPHGPWLGRGLGIAMLGTGLWLLLA